MRNSVKLFALAAIGLSLPLHAYAYLDPGTGSVIIQALIAVVVAAGMYLRRIRDFFLGLFARKANAPARGEPDAQPAGRGGDTAGDQ